MDVAWKMPPLRRDAVPIRRPWKTRQILHRPKFWRTRCSSDIRRSHESAECEASLVQARVGLAFDDCNGGHLGVHSISDGPASFPIPKFASFCGALVADCLSGPLVCPKRLGREPCPSQVLVAMC